MKKEFTIPPVVFPSTSSATTATVSGGGNFQGRRAPTVPFQPSRPSNPSIPFMSFEIGAPSFSATTSLHGGATTTSTSSTFLDEPPLLEELEIDPTLIYRKTLLLLNPVRVNSAIHNSVDLSGPFLYYISFCLFQILAGKFQFGVVLGWIVLFSTFLYIVFNMLMGKSGNLDLYRCFSLVGYSFLPVVVFSAVSLFIPQGGAVSFALAAVFVLWATRVCTRLLVEGALYGDEHFGACSIASAPQFCPVLVSHYASG